MAKTVRASCLLIGTMTLAASELGAQSSAMEELRARLKSPDQFGTECCQMLSIPASAFAPTAYYIEYFRNLSYPGFLTVSFDITTPMWAPVTMPTGAVLDNIDLYYRDSDPESDICAALHAYGGPTLGGSPPSDVTLGFVCSSGSSGVGYNVESMSGTIDNSVWFSNGAQYAVVLSSLVGASHMFKGVTIWWHRQVRPAPGTATFNDVPTSHPQFQFVEALVDAGITVGCGGGNYCPDNSLTRGQMAVFLAKALGLYWPF